METGNRHCASRATFQRHFDTHLAHSLGLLHKTYRVRYQVYCKELALEPAAQFPDGLETDEFDPHSLHCLIVHKGTGQSAACVRLVLASDKRYLPLEKYCHESIYCAQLPTLEQRYTIGELSRLAVDTRFRTALEHDPETAILDGHSASVLGKAAYLAGFALADIAGRPSIYGMMEPWLPRLVRRSGVTVNRVGDTTDYHGRRAAYHITVPEIVSQLNEDSRQLFDSLRGSLRAQLSEARAVA